MPRGVQADDLPVFLLPYGKQAGARTREFRGPADQAPGKLGQMQVAVDFAGQFDQGFSPVSVLLRKMQIARHLERDRCLIRQRTGATNILLRNSRAIQPVENSEHPQNPSAHAQQWHRQKLVHLVFRHRLQIDSGSPAGLVGPENFLRAQGTRGHALRKQRIGPPRFPFFDRVTNPELVLFEKRNEATSETQKVGDPQDEGLQKVIEIAAGAEFGGNLQQLMQFVRLRMRRGVQFRMGHGDRPETGNHRHQCLFFRREDPLLPGIDQNRALSARSAKRSGDQHSGRNQIAQGVHIGADRKCNRLSRRHCALRQVRREAQRLPIVPRPCRSRQLRSFRRNPLQFKRTLAAQQYANQLGAQQQPNPVGQGLEHCGNIGRSMQHLGNFRQNFSATILRLRGLAPPPRLQQAPQLPRQDRGLGRQAFIEELEAGIVQERNRSRHFIKNR